MYLEKKKEMGKHGKRNVQRELLLYPARPDMEERYPSMPETWNVAESKPERQVSGMAGYVVSN